MIASKHLQPATIKGKELAPHKSVVNPDLTARTVLTNSPWTFVTLWLKRNKKRKALFYWEQAQYFHEASKGLPTQSAPLMLYYCFMNATKALLSAKGIQFDEHHGVRQKNMRNPNSKLGLSNEGIRILSKGIAPSLSQYYGEAETNDTHSLQDLLFNLAFIHRTYCLTYKSQQEMFIPLVLGKFLWDERDKRLFFGGQVTNNLTIQTLKNRLPRSFAPCPELGERGIRTTAYVSWPRPKRPTPASVRLLLDYHRILRSELHYINGTQTLWYLRSTVKGPATIRRQVPTMILMAMHRLSEICRYRPQELASHLSGQRNWLLSEFIEMSPIQFVDELASEMTGCQFLIPNVRSAN